MTAIGQGFDFVVVGAGTAGCALAARLSEDARHSVCLVEAGGSGRSYVVDVPGAVSLAQRSDPINWRFQSVPQPQLHDRRVSVPRGRGLGGSALINGMVYFRGHPRDYDDWSMAGATGWSFREVLPYFCRTENNENFGGSALHGRGGAMNVRTVTRPNPLNYAFLNALAGLGYHRREDLAGLDTEGAALRQLTIRGGRRETTASALLYPALARPNLTVIKQARVTRILLQGRRAVGVETQGEAGTLQIQARLQVVISAGAIHSPQLLMLSGIGDPAHLAEVGIPVQHALPGVGRNLHDHLASPIQMATRHPASYGISWRAMPRNLVNLAEYLLLRTGPLANNIFESAAFVRTLPDLDRPDVQLVFQPAKRPGPAFAFPIGHGMAISPVGLYPRSRGRLSLASADPHAAPLIDPNLLADPRDLEPLLRGIRLARKVFASPQFAPFQATETSPGPQATSDADLVEHVRSQAYTVHHPVSTCRMGIDTGAVVDPQLKVMGLENLRIADASVFPSVIGGNTNAAVVMVAEKAADLILGRPALAPVDLHEAPEPAAARR